MTKAKRAVEMTGLWKAWKAKSRLSPLTTAPWKSRQKAGEIPTFPQLRRLRGGKVENQNQVSHFPTAISLLNNERQTGGLRPPPSARRFAPHRARGYALTMSVVVEEKTRKLLTDVDHCFTL